VQLIDRNFNILKSVINSMKPLNPSAVILLVANPVDILTYFAQKLSGLPTHQVFGSGTFLDTARLRGAIARKVGVADTAVHAYVMGEHGDSQFVAWSSSNIGTVSLDKFPEVSGDAVREKLAVDTKNKAYDIIKAKGATYFGIAACVRYPINVFTL
jgi:L-lactate dehydrogenase